MLPGLSKLEIGRLRMSVGYGTHKTGRLLSPVEVARLLQRAIHAGASLSDCASALGFKGTTWPSRFLSVLALPAEILHLVDWGRTDNSAIGFTTAVEVARMEDDDEKRTIGLATLEHQLQTDEIRQIAQIRKRSHRPIQDCLQEVLGMRPIVERRYVFVGALAEEALREAVTSLSQAQRNSLLHDIIDTLGLEAEAGRLGEQLFTLVGGDRFNDILKERGQQVVEAQIRGAIRESFADA